MTSRIKYNNPKISEALGLPYHYEMISDSKRVQPFKAAIIASCKEKRVLESGAGSAILSILAAKAGAKKVFAIEIDKKIAKIANENIKKSGFSEIITLIVKDVKDITLEDLGQEKIDVVIAENLSTWQVTEPQIQILNHLNQTIVSDNFKTIPQKIFNNIELGFAQYKFEGIEIRTQFFEFTGVNKSTTFSEKKLFEKIDLCKRNPIQINKKIHLVVDKTGVINCIRLTSPLQVFGDIIFDTSDSLMPPVVFPFTSDISVEVGEVVEVNIVYHKNTTWDGFSCEAKVVQ